MRPALAVLVGWSLALSACGGDSHLATPAPNYADPCAASADCVGGLSCAELPMVTGGLCTARCDAAPCPDGGRCEDVFGARLCLARCAADADCGREDLQCFRGVCRPRCGADADCGPDARCEAGECNGGACTLPSDCGAALLCVSDEAGASCAAACADSAACGDLRARRCAPVALDTDGDATPDTVGAACVALAPAEGATGSACASDGECAARACVDGECAEVCDDASDCLLGQECVGGRARGGLGGTFSGCGHAPVTSPTLVDLPLGAPRVRAGGVSADLTFAVPDDAVSVTFVAHQTSGAEALPVTFVDIVSPTGESLFSLTDITSWVDPPNRWLPSETEGIAAILVPNTTSERVAFRGGRHSVSVGLFPRFAGDTASASFEVVARIKRAPGARVSGGALDLNVFCATTGVTAASAPSNARLSRALDEFAAVYASRGVTLGAVRYFDVGGASFRVIDTVDGPTSELSQLFALSAGRTEQAIDLFLVDALVGTRDGFTLLGVAGGIPGPPATHGTGHSGVVVAFPAAVAGTAASLGDTIAHELGHYLGLFHNAESVRACAAGTGPTATTSCAPFGGGDVLADTAPSDTSNLMYWAALGGTALSPGQGYVMLRSALVR